MRVPPRHGGATTSHTGEAGSAWCRQKGVGLVAPEYEPNRRRARALAGGGGVSVVAAHCSPLQPAPASPAPLARSSPARAGRYHRRPALLFARELEMIVAAAPPRRGCYPPTPTARSKRSRRTPRAPASRARRLGHCRGAGAGRATRAAPSPSSLLPVRCWCRRQREKWWRAHTAACRWVCCILCALGARVPLPACPPTGLATCCTAARQGGGSGCSGTSCSASPMHVL